MQPVIISSPRTAASGVDEGTIVDVATETEHNGHAVHDLTADDSPEEHAQVRSCLDYAPWPGLPVVAFSHG